MSTVAETEISDRLTSRIVYRDRVRVRRRASVAEGHDPTPPAVRKGHSRIVGEDSSPDDALTLRKLRNESAGRSLRAVLFSANLEFEGSLGRKPSRPSIAGRLVRLHRSEAAEDDSKAEQKAG
jgi:hypothetical protein